ncbi:MAG TPA: twin-arginine translocation signal domain-containing protein, partial [Bryobacteraceae bacterium]|nr:twin-arginine translocation signal domain-containing protein [Bryobacteraceae bacterium]
MNRRDFLGGVPLIGTALAAGPYQPTTVASLKGAVKSVVIPTHEFAGNLDERLDFPADWEVNVMDMRGRNAPVLSSSEIRRRLD